MLTRLLIDAVYQFTYSGKAAGIKRSSASIAEVSGGTTVGQVGLPEHSIEETPFEAVNSRTTAVAMKVIVGLPAMSSKLFINKKLYCNLFLKVNVRYMIISCLYTCTIHMHLLNQSHSISLNISPL